MIEAGRAEEAVRILSAASEADPRNTDILRRFAQALAAAGNLPGALRTIDRAVAIAPQDNDLLLVRSYILLWSGRSEDARQQSAVIAERAPAYPGLAQLETAIARGDARPDSSARSGAALYSSLSGIDFESGVSDTWYGAGASVFGPIGEAGVVTASVDHEERNSSDTRLSARLDRRIGQGNFFLATSITPNADFREQWSLSVGGELPVSPTADIIVDAKYAEYRSGHVTVLRPALRLHLAERLSLTGQWINLFENDGNHRSGVSGRFDYVLANEGNLYLGAATYPDTEAGVTRQVRGAFIGTALPLSDRVTLRGAFEYEERDQSYQRIAATIGLSLRFGS